LDIVATGLWEGRRNAVIGESLQACPNRVHSRFECRRIGSGSRIQLLRGKR
jgi:hypothetical protein